MKNHKKKRVIEKQPFGIMNSGWNKDDLADVLDWSHKISQMMYDIKNCRRGGYCREIGDTTDSLVNYLSDRYAELGDIIQNIQDQVN